MTSTEVALAILLMLTGVLLSPYGDDIRSWLFTRGGELSGRWKETLEPGYHKAFPRVDEIKVRHRKRSGRLKAAVRRVEPDGERDRHWKMEGFVRGGEAVLMFWPIGKHHDGSSFGVILLHRDATAAGTVWRGSYIRPATDVPGTGGRSNLAPIGVEWKRFSR